MFPFKPNIMYGPRPMSNVPVAADPPPHLLHMHHHPHQQHPHHPHHQLLSPSPFSNQNAPPPPPLLIGVGPRMSSSQSPADGSHSAGEVPIQWPLNPASYQDLANDQVDWAALAQQWIHMKETCTTDQLLAAPPPPIISRPDNQFRQQQPPPHLQSPHIQPQLQLHNSNRHDGDEQGEAPMEMDRDDDDDESDEIGGDVDPYPVPMNMLMMPPLTQAAHLCQPPPNWLPPPQQMHHHQQQQPHPMPVRSADVVMPTDAASDAPWLQQVQQQAPPPPVISNQWSKKPAWNPWNTSGPHAIPPLRPNHPQHQQRHTHPYAGNVQHPRPPKGVRNPAPTFAGGKSEEFWPKNKQTAQLTALVPHQQQSIDGPADGSAFTADGTSTLDAAKRKTLPAWIRLGLEKMEREKQRQAEHEERERQRLVAQKEQQQHVAELLGDEAGKSKFDSDDSSASELDEDDSGEMARIQSPGRSQSNRPMKPQRSRAEQLQDLMMLVRGSLTEILLEVTNEEIRQIASETLSRNRLKARTAQTVKKSALSSLTGGLGLGIYADSDQSDDDDNGSDDEDAQRDKDHDADLDAELQASIRRKKIAFEARIIEIEADLKAADEAEQSWLAEDGSRQCATDDDDSEDKIGVDASNDSTLAASKTPHSTNTDTDAENSSKPADKYRWNRRTTAVETHAVIGEVQPHDQKIVQPHAASVHPQHGRQGERKASRFSDPRDTVRHVQLTHGSIVYGLPRGGGVVGKPAAATATVTTHNQSLTPAAKTTEPVASASANPEAVTGSKVEVADMAVSVGSGTRVDGDASSVASSRSGSKRGGHKRRRSRSRSRSRSSKRSAEIMHHRHRPVDCRSKRRSPSASPDRRRNDANGRKKKTKSSSRRSRSRSTDRKHSNRHRY